MNVDNTKMMDIKNIVLRFRGVVAIQNISFDIFKGEIRAIIGPNGAGKSSMLNVINGFYHPQEGEVWFRGKSLKIHPKCLDLSAHEKYWSGIG